MSKARQTRSENPSGSCVRTIWRYCGTYGKTPPPIIADAARWPSTLPTVSLYSSLMIQSILDSLMGSGEKFFLSLSSFLIIILNSRIRLVTYHNNYGRDSLNVDTKSFYTLIFTALQRFSDEKFSDWFLYFILFLCFSQSQPTHFHRWLTLQWLRPLQNHLPLDFVSFRTEIRTEINFTRRALLFSLSNSFQTNNSPFRKNRQQKVYFWCDPRILLNCDFYHGQPSRYNRILYKI